jgi:hypothetical protein
MGLLVVGTPLAWEESKKYIPKVKKDGVTQFLALYDRLKGRPEEPLLWGDEVSPASLARRASAAATTARRLAPWRALRQERQAQPRHVVSWVDESEL